MGEAHVARLGGGRLPGVLAGALGPPPGQYRLAARLTAAGNVTPSGECYSPAATPAGRPRTARKRGYWLNGAQQVGS